MMWSDDTLTGRSPSGGGGSVDLDPDEGHRSLGVAAIGRLERARDEVEAGEGAGAKAQMPGDRKVANEAGRELADAIDRAVMAAGGSELVILGTFGAGEE